MPYQPWERSRAILASSLRPVLPDGPYPGTGHAEANSECVLEDSPSADVTALPPIVSSRTQNVRGIGCFEKAPKGSSDHMASTTTVSSEKSLERRPCCQTLRR